MSSQFIDLGSFVNLKDNSFTKKRVSNGVLKVNIYENKLLLQKKMNEISNYTDKNICEYFKHSLDLIYDRAFCEKYNITDKFFNVFSSNSSFKEDCVFFKRDKYLEVSSLYGFYEVDKLILGDEFVNFLFDLERVIKSIDSSKNLKRDSFFKIVLAGQFSAGKSTFINTLLQNDLLPNDITETSSIATLVNFDDKIDKVNVKGVNKNKAFVPIDVQLLEYLKHGTQANEMLAQVIDRLIVSVPNSFSNNFVLVDTPGHNKSDVKNAFNNKRDYDVALEMTIGADAILYLADISKGGLQESDCEFLQRTDKNSEVYIIFTKAMHKPYEDVKKIVDETVRNLFGQNNFSNQSKEGICKIKKIFAYDSLEKEVVYIPAQFNKGRKITIGSFINELVKDSVQQEENYWSKIDSLFYNITEVYDDKIRDAEEEYKGLLTSELEFDKNKEKVNEMLETLHSYEGVFIVKEMLDNKYDNLIKNRNNCVFRIKYFNEINNLLGELYQAFYVVFKEESNAYHTEAKQVEKNKATREGNTNKNIYDIIEDNDLESFLIQLSTEGIKVLNYNSQNYSAMTYAVKNGNLDMVKIFLENNIDIALLDKRGYNMFHTAIEYGNIRIIELLLKYDSKVLDSKTRNREGYKELIKKQSYYNKIKNLIEKHGT